MVQSVTGALMGDPGHRSVITAALEPKPSASMATDRLAVSLDPKLGGVEPKLSDEIGQLPGPGQYAENAHCPEPTENPESWAAPEVPANLPTLTVNSHSQVRPIAAMDFGGLTFQPVPTALPTLEWMEPADLLVDETYQRGLGPKGRAQIRRIAEHWDWRRVKPVIAAWTENGFEIIDGQHTAIAAATRGVEKIPVMVVEAADLVDRAGAFVGQNRDRIALTPMQLHHAAVAAQEPDALTVQQVCAKAGVNLIQSPFGGYDYQPADTMAVGVLQAVIGRRGAMRAREILQALVAAGLAPITANDIKAAELLFTDPEYADELEPLPEGALDLAAAIRTLGAGWAKEAKERAAIKCLPLWKAQAGVWFRKCRKRRKTP